MVNVAKRPLEKQSTTVMKDNSSAFLESEYQRTNSGSAQPRKSKAPFFFNAQMAANVGSLYSQENINSKSVTKSNITRSLKSQCSNASMRAFILNKNQASKSNETEQTTSNDESNPALKVVSSSKRSRVNGSLEVSADQKNNLRIKKPL